METTSGLTPPGGWEDALIIAQWPEALSNKERDAQAEEDFNLLQEMIRAIRNIRAEYKVQPGHRIACTIGAGEDEDEIQAQRKTFISLAGIDPDAFNVISSPIEPSEECITLVIAPYEISLPLAGLVDVTAERERLEKELKEAEGQINRLTKLLSGPFAEKAPQPVIEKEGEKLAAYQETAERIKAQLG